jgi:O-antigen ligase
MIQSQLAYQRPLFILLLLFAFCLPLSKSAATVLLTIGWLMVLVLAFMNREFRRMIVQRLNQPLLTPLLLLLAVALFGLFFTNNLNDGRGVINKIGSMPLIYLLLAILAGIADDRHHPFRMLDSTLFAFIAGILVLDMIGLLTYLGVIGQKRFVLPLAPLHLHHIWFSNLNAVGIYAALSFFLFGRERLTSAKRALLAGFIALAILCILLSISRTAWFSMIATGMILSWLLTERKRIFYLTVAALLAGAILAYLLNPIVHSRVSGIFSDISQYRAGQTYTSLGDRLIMWDAAVKMFLSNPLIGVGTGDYMTTMREYIATGTVPARIWQYNQPHNMYLFSLATNGILGIATLLYLFTRIFTIMHPLRNAPEERKQAYFLAATVGVHYLVAGLTDSLFNIFLLRYTFVFIMGLCIHKTLVNPQKSHDSLIIP